MDDTKPKSVLYFRRLAPGLKCTKWTRSVNPSFQKEATLVTVKEFLVRWVSTVLLGLPTVILRNVAYGRYYKESIFVKYGTKFYCPANCI